MSSPPIWPRADNVLKGIGFVLVMGVCFATLDATAKFMGHRLPVLVVVWGRFIFNLLFLLVFFARGDPLRLLATRAPGLQVLRAVLMVGSTVSFWMALAYLPLASAVTIGFASPMIVTALSVPLLGERVGVWRWGAVIAGMIGVIVALRPGSGTLQWAAGLPLITATCYALYQIVTRRLAGVDPPAATMVWTAGGGLLLSTAAVPFDWATPGLADWGILAWMGLLGAGGHYFLIRAFESAPPAALAPFFYTTLLWAVVYGFFLFAETPDAETLAGAGIIVASGLFIAHRERVAARRGTRTS